MKTATVTVERSTFGFAVVCSECGPVRDETARIYVDLNGVEAPTWHSQYAAGLAMQRHQCA